MKTSAILRGDLYILLRLVLIFLLLLSKLYKGEINTSFLFLTKLISLFSLLLLLLSKLELFTVWFSFMFVLFICFILEGYNISSFLEGDISIFIFCSLVWEVYRDNSRSFAFSFFGILFWFFNNELIKRCDSINKFFFVFLFLLLLSFFITLLLYELMLFILKLFL